MPYLIVLLILLCGCGSRQDEYMFIDETIETPNGPILTLKLVPIKP
jgi:hypothetical protein